MNSNIEFRELKGVKKHEIELRDLVKFLPEELKIKLIEYLLGSKNVHYAVERGPAIRIMNLNFFRYRNCVDLNWENWESMNGNTS